MMTALYFKCLREVVRDCYEIAGEHRILPHLRVAALSHAKAAYARRLALRTKTIKVQP